MTVDPGSTGTVPDIDPSLVTTGMPTDGGILYINFGDNPKVPTDATTPLGAGWSPWATSTRTP